MNINDLPVEIIVNIFNRVDIGNETFESFLNDLFKCGICNIMNKKCIHLHWIEVCNIANIRLVCSYWNNIISSSYNLVF